MHELTFIGTATTILRLGAFTLLTDPNFLRQGQKAYLGKGLSSRRLTQPAMQPEDLPKLDAVVLSHLHGDHFDRVAKAKLDRSTPVYSTIAASRKLGSWGFDAHGLGTWEDVQLTSGDETLRIEAMPARHATGIIAPLLPPVMGSMIEHRVGGVMKLRLYVSGDTVMGDHLDVIHERYPDIDVAVVHLGGTRVLRHTVTMDAEQGVAALEAVRPARAVPVHYDDYGVFRSPLQDFVLGAHASGWGPKLRTVDRGQTISLDH